MHESIERLSNSYRPRRNVSETGAVNCDRGVTCHYAHSRSELRSSSGGMGSMGNGMGNGMAGDMGAPGPLMPPGTFDYAHGAKSGTFDYGHGAAKLAGKRKVTNAKTALCKNFRETGNCQWGEYCNFAHGVAELAVNKRQRL